MQDFDSVNFAGFPCLFECSSPSLSCGTWQWKLDAYRCPNRLSEHPSLLFRSRGGEAISPGITAKVYEAQDGFFLHQVFTLADKGTMWRHVRKKSGEILLSYYISRDWDEVILLEDNTSDGGNMAFEYLCHIFPSCGLMLGLLTLHGVLLEHKGMGLIISAPSGTGKTTHARLWRDTKNALIINGDRAVCRKLNGSWTGFGLPWSGTSGEQINRSVQIKAMVVLERGEENRAFQVNGIDAFSSAWANVLKPGWNKSLVGKALDLLDDFLQSIPIVRLRCRPDPDSVEVLLSFLEDMGWM